MPEQVYKVMLWCLDVDPKSRPSFGEIIDIIGGLLVDRDVLNREMTKFTTQASSSGNTSNETIMRPPMNAGLSNSLASYLQPLISPGSKFGFLDRHMQRNRSLATAGSNTPNTGTCSTVTTIVYGSNNQSEGSNASALHNAQANGPADSRMGRRRRSRPSTVADIAESARESVIENLQAETVQTIQDRLVKQNDQLNAKLTDQLKALQQNKPFIQKISGQSLNRLSEIFRKDGSPRESAELRDGKADSSRSTSSSRSQRLNRPESNDETDKLMESTDKPGGELSNHCEPFKQEPFERPNSELLNKKPSHCDASKEPVNCLPTAKDELILTPNKLKVYPPETGSNGSFIQTHNV